MSGLLVAAAAPAQAAPPANDDIAGARALTGERQVAGTNLDAGLEPGEPTHPSLSGKSVWYAWTAPSGADALDWVRVSTYEADFDTVLTVYSGSPAPFDGLTEVAFNDDFWNENARSRVTFQPVPGDTYYVSVDGADWGDGALSGRFGLRFREAAGLGFISGKVTDSDGHGVEDVCVYVVDDDGNTDGPPGTTEANGDYLLHGAPAVPDNRLLFRNCHGSALASEYYDGPGNDGAQTVAGATGVAVLPGEETEHINAVLTPGGVITGTVTGAEGADVSDVCVRAFNTAGGDPGYVAHAVTDGSGHYALSGLDGGSHRLLFGDTASADCSGTNADVVMQSYGDDGSAGSYDAVEVVEGTTVSGIDVELRGNPGRIRGVVRNVSTNAALPYICVRASNASFVSSIVDTAANGSYTIPNVPAGTDYVVRFSDCHATLDPYVTQYYDGKLTPGAANTVAVMSGLDTEPVNAHLYRMATIAGSVTDPHGNPRDNACVELYESGEGKVDETEVADSDGSWMFSAAPGTYTVLFTKCDGSGGLTFEPRWWDDQFLPQDAQPITVTEHQVVDNLDAVLTGTGAGQITGVVTDDNDLPLEGICVYASYPGWQASGVTDENGRYWMGVAPRTDYTIQFRECAVGDHNVFPQFWDDVSESGTPTPITVLAGSKTAGIDARLRTGGQITGRLVDAQGAGVRGICVDVYEPDGDITYRDDFYSDATGHYTVSTLETGTYKVQYVDCTKEYVDQWYADAAVIEDADTISVTAGSVTTLSTVALTRNGTISGIVRNEAGDPVEGVCAFAYTLDGDNIGWADDYITNEHGYYLIGDLPTGDYRVNFVACSTEHDYGDEWYDNKLSQADADLVHVVYGQDTSINPVLQDTAPVNTTPPSIGGGTDIGDTLTAGHGTWQHQPSGYAYEWERCDAVGSSCDPINDASDSTYVTTAGDAGHRIKVVVVATNSKGHSTATSPASDVIGLPRVLDPPAVSGPISVGGTMSTTSGTWSGSPAFTYQWMRCDGSASNCTPIGGQTATSYVTTGSDAGHRLRVNVTATNAVGSVTRLSLSNGTVVGGPSSIDAPAVTGPAAIGETLSVSTGTWTGSPTSFAYQWLRCDTAAANCTPISGATSTAYVTTNDDSGHKLRVNVTATNAVGSNTRQSTSNGLVVGAPGSLDAPAVSGSPTVGANLSVSNGTWSGFPHSFGYQWTRCDAAGADCTPISGATTAAYLTTGDDSGHKLRVLVTATNAIGSTTRLSLSNGLIGGVAGVPGAPESLDTPAVTGPSTINATLSVSDGTWSGAPTSFAYQWMRCSATGADCVAIDGAVSSTYLTTNDDSGHKIRANVTATNASGSATRLSTSNGYVTGKPASLDLPAVTGQARAGATLTITNGTWSGSPTSFTYQWTRCDAVGADCVPIDGAVAATYAATGADVGSRIRVLVTASNAIGNATRLSLSNGVIGPA